MRKETKWKIFSTVNDGSWRPQVKDVYGQQQEQSHSIRHAYIFRKRLTWYGVKDPESLKRLVKSLMRR
jgi:hypothetical protein